MNDVRSIRTATEDATGVAGRPHERSTLSMARLRAWLDRTGAPAAVLTRPASVAWLTGGVAPPVDRTASVDLVWAVVTPGGATLVTTNVERDRVLDEYGPSSHGFDLVTVRWYEPDAFVDAAVEAAGAGIADVASDGHPAFARDAAEDLVALRLTLTDPECDDMRSLGADAADALEGSLREWRPGERDLDVQARVAASLELAGADAPVLIVGADDRIRRYRHPMAVGAPANDLVMTVVVARRAGLHAAATRFASAGPLSPEDSAVRARALRIERAVLEASAPGAAYGDALAALDAAYTAEGAADGWAGHYQGGPIGFEQREFEIAPSRRSSRWYTQPIEAGQAVAWNPSLPGGAKAEDTYLVGAAGPERLTAGTGDWPPEPADAMAPPRPGVLEVGA